MLVVVVAIESLSSETIASQETSVSLSLIKKVKRSSAFLDPFSIFRFYKQVKNKRLQTTSTNEAKLWICGAGVSGNAILDNYCNWMLRNRRKALHLLLRKYISQFSIWRVLYKNGKLITGETRSLNHFWSHRGFSLYLSLSLCRSLACLCPCSFLSAKCLHFEFLWFLYSPSLVSVFANSPFLSILSSSSLKNHYLPIIGVWN